MFSTQSPPQTLKNCDNGNASHLNSGFRPPHYTAAHTIPLSPPRPCSDSCPSFLPVRPLTVFTVSWPLGPWDCCELVAPGLLAPCCSQNTEHQTWLKAKPSPASLRPGPTGPCIRCPDYPPIPLCPCSSVPLWPHLLEGTDLNFDSYTYGKAWAQQESPLPLSSHLRLLTSSRPWFPVLPFSLLEPGSFQYLLFLVASIFSSPIALSPSSCLQICSSNRLTKLCYSFSKYGPVFCVFLKE